MPFPTAGDEARWADAHSLLARVPTESTDDRLSSRRRRRFLSLIGVALGSVSATMIVVVLLRTRSVQEAAVLPTWQTVGGSVIAVAGLVFEVVGAVTLARGTGRLRARQNVVDVLSRGQRRQLRAEVRGRSPVDPAHILVARTLAELLVEQQSSVTVQAGLAIFWAGAWIARPATLPAVASGCFVLLVAVVWTFATRGAGRARRFLDAQPVPGE